MARPRIKPQFNEEMLGINPFVAGSFKIKAREIKNKRKIADVTDVLENSDSIINDIQETTYTSLIEYETYCKVFNKAAFRLHIGSLTAKAKVLFLWLQYEVKHSEDFIFINVNRYCEEFNTSYNTYQAALEELILSGVLALSTIDKVYWVNPMFLFTGNRLKKYPKNIKQIQ